MSTPNDAILLASTNAGKIAEFAELCQSLSLQAVTPTQWQQRTGQPLPDAEETGTTFQENALIKALAAHKQTGLNCVADDSGLCVQALQGEPGIYSARYGGGKSDAERRAHLLAKLEEIDDRRAHFSCALVLAGPLAAGPGCGYSEDGIAWRAFAGRTDGRLLREEQGTSGFGYDSLFFHDGLGATFAQVDASAKHALSHRGRAFAQLALYLTATQLRASQTQKPLYVRPAALQALALSMGLCAEKSFRYADVALEQALGRHPTLGSKERAAVAQLHWHALRRLGFFRLAIQALRGTQAPNSAPDPLQLRHADGQALAILSAADVDAFGQPLPPLGKRNAASCLQDLSTRTPTLTLPLPADAYGKALRAAAHVAQAWPERQRLAIELGYTETFLSFLSEELGAEHAQLALQYLNHRGPLTVRANPSRITTAQLQAVLAAAQIANAPLPGLPNGILCLDSGRLTTLPEFNAGAFEIQDEGSQRIAALVAAQPSETVLDWCAGAGGKTLALGADMAGQGTLIALDNHAKRLTECTRRALRAGLNVRTEVLGVHNPRLPLADAVLVDAPCSSTGALRRNPELRWHLDASWLSRFPEQQLAILQRASQFVKPGGRLVYATCSLMRRENEGVVASLCAADPGWTIEQEQRIGPADLAYLRTMPLAETGADGFYCCVLRRATTKRQRSASAL